MSIRNANDGGYLANDEQGEALFAGAPADDTFSVVDRHSAFDGTFRADRDLRVEGEVKGTIECQGTLFVAQGATVTAKVEAENITVAGDLNGDIRCRGRLQMLASGRVRGKVSTDTLVVNEGAYYEGQLEMAAPEARASQAPRQLATGAAEPLPMTPSPGEARSGEGRPGATTFIRRLGTPETAWDTVPENEPEPSTPVEEEGVSPPR